MEYNIRCDAGTIPIHVWDSISKTTPVGKVKSKHILMIHLSKEDMEYLFSSFHFSLILHESNMNDVGIEQPNHNK